MLGKWVRFNNKIPVNGISWAQGFPIPKILGYKRSAISQPPESRKTENRSFARIREVHRDDDSMTEKKRPFVRQWIC